MIHKRSNMSCFNLFRVFGYSLALMFVLVCEPSSAQSQIVLTDNPIGSMLTVFENITGNMRIQFHLWTTTLFYSLVLIEFTVSAFKLAMSGGADLGSVFEFLMVRLATVGLFVYLFEWGYPVVNAIVSSFIRAGNNVVTVPLTPDGVFQYGLELVKNIESDTAWWTKENVLIGFLKVCIIFLFSLISANIAIAIAELYIVLTAGVMTLGFLGSSFTRDWALGYFRYAVASGVKFVSMAVLIATVMQSMEAWFPSDGTVGLEAVLAMIGTLTVAYMLSKTVPNAAAAMISGHANGGMGFVGGGRMANSVKSSVVNSTTRASAGASNVAVKSLTAVGGGAMGAAKAVGSKGVSALKSGAK